jgi:hypothetical protein
MYGYKTCDSCRAKNWLYDHGEAGRARRHRYNTSERGRSRNSKIGYARIIERRRYLGNGMRGIELFNRCIGYNLISPDGGVYWNR